MPLPAVPLRATLPDLAVLDDDAFVRRWGPLFLVAHAAHADFTDWSISSTDPGDKPSARGPFGEYVVVFIGAPDHERVAIGRDPACDLRLRDGKVSARHATIARAGAGRWLVEDAGSRNGTFVDDAQIDRPTPLASRQRLRFASVETMILDVAGLRAFVAAVRTSAQP